MKLFLVLAYVLSHSFANGQPCAELPPLSTIEADFRSSVNTSDQAGSIFSLGEVFYNCIAYGSPDGSTFRETRITARYQVEDGNFLGQVLYACVSMNGNMVWVSDDVGVVLKTGSAANGTERCNDCRELSDTTCTVCTDDCGQGQLNSDCSGCVCNSGYTGPACDTDINECQDTPSVCEGGAICANFDGGHNCTCPEPCTGECNACCSSPCTRGGTCTSNSPEDFNCNCPPGHTGKRCQDFVGGCLSDPCMNNGICNMIGLSVDQYQCSCPVGFTGVNCQTEIDYCSDEPCRYEGWCTSYRTGYTCTCLHGFTGEDCGQPLSTCSSNSAACGVNGECIERTVDGLTIKTCSCSPGYGGEICNIIIDSCTNNMEPCFHRSMCNPNNEGNSNVSFSCNCSSNWSGFYCTECSLECEADRQPDARCTTCVCNAPNTDDMCNPTVSTQDPNSNTDNSNDDTGIIAGSVVGGFAVVGIAVVMVIIAIYFVVHSSKSRQIVRPSWMDDTNDPFAHAKQSSIPRFSGSVLGTDAAFGRRQGSLYGKNSSNELSGNDDTKADSLL